jgi:CRP-like cAMP-binding protein
MMDMSNNGEVMFRNGLLAFLPFEERLRLLEEIELVELRAGDILCHSGEKISHVYFPEEGLISLIATMVNGATVETGIVGREGMVGMPVFLGAESAPYCAIAHIAGEAWRLTAEVLRDELDRSSVLRQRLLLYAQALMTQMSQMAACNCLHTLEERLGSLLLMIHDRIDSGKFFLTHEVIAEMLGVRRAGITVAAGKLRRAGVIHNLRGHFQILDRDNLESCACECYRAIREESDRLLETEAVPPLTDGSGVVQCNDLGLKTEYHRGRESVRVM